MSEHIETLSEIDLEYHEIAMKAGITGWARVPALGLNPDFISDLAQMVLETSSSSTLRESSEFEDLADSQLLR